MRSTFFDIEFEFMDFSYSNSTKKTEFSDFEVPALEQTKTSTNCEKKFVYSKLFRGVPRNLKRGRVAPCFRFH